MEAHRSSYIQGSSESQLSIPGASGALSSSLPVYVSTFEKNYPSLPNSQLLHVPRELNANPMAFYSSSPSDNGAVGHMFSSTHGLGNELYVPSVGPLENHSRNSPILSQLPNTGASLPVTTCRSIMLQSTPLNNNGSRFTDPLAEIFGYYVNTPIKINEVGRDNINGDSNVEDPQPKSSFAINSISSPSGASKQRMRWTLELHEAFVEAVSKLGGSKKATPRDVVDLLAIEGLTKDHVKSHLQKYRATTNARYRPESSEGSSEKRIAPIQEVSPLELKTGIDITKALQFQLELQKRLHEQLENQRNLQLQVEQYGEFLQKMMYENQCKGASTSSPVNLCPQPRHAIPSSLDQNELGTSWVENEGREENDGVIEMTTSVRVSRRLEEKQKAPETEAYEDLEKMLQGQGPALQKRKRMKGPLIPQSKRS